MDRINGAGTVDIGGGRRGFIDENLGVGQEGTEVTALWLNMTQEEMIKVIESAGLVLNPADWTQLWQALQILGLSAGARSRRWTAVISMTLSSAPGAPAAGDTYLVPTGASGIWATQVGKIAEWNGTAWYYFTPVNGHGISLPDGRVFERVAGVYVEKLALDAQTGKWNFAVAAGTANALTVTLFPTPLSIENGMRIWIFPSAVNTGPATLDVNGLGVASILDDRAQPLAAGDLQQRATELIYVGGNWRLINKPGGTLNRVITIAAAGAGTYVPSPGTRRIIVRGQGGGGAGGGCPATGAGNAAAGGGGSCGAFGFKEIQNPGNTNYVVGAGGVAVNGLAGGAGGNTTFGAVLTLPGGGGGSAGTAVPGASSNGSYTFSAAPTGADQGSRGQGGGFGVTVSATSAIGGCGGSGQYGSGGSHAGQNGTGALSGSAAAGNGAGGGGAAAVGSGVTAIGGNGAPGILIIEEYS